MTFDIYTNVTSQSNTWYALQTFGNNISIGGASFNISGLASGNLIQYNGTNWVNVAVGTALGGAATVMINPANESVTGAGTQMYGFGADTAGTGAHPVVFTPINTGKVKITFTFDMYNSVSSLSQTLQMYYGTGGAPANGAGVVGTALGPSLIGNNGTTTGSINTITRFISGLTPSTQYWFDLSGSTEGGNAMNLNSFTAVIEELLY